MRAGCLILALCLAASVALPAGAQQGAGRLDQLFSDMLGAVDPWLRDLGDVLGDLSGWHAPEVLPNGDILIRRRQPDQDAELPSVDDSGGLEL